MRHIPGKAENISMSLSTQINEITPGLTREEAAIIVLQNTIEKAVLEGELVTHTESL